nr:uncharacterized protein LOC111998510 [Quercus suber]
MEERRKKGLCFNCDEKFQHGHHCKPAKLFSLEGLCPFQGPSSSVQLVELNEGDSALAYNSEVPHLAFVESKHNMLEPEITQYDLLGSPSPGTMRIRSTINGHWVIILIDIGSTYDFLDAAILSKLQLQLDPTVSFEVKVANGEKIKTKGVCVDVEWDFLAFSMQFMHLGRPVTLFGLHPTNSTLQEGTSPFKLACDPLIEKLLVEGYEHQILLKDGTTPICQRPYRYPHFQKIEIEKIIADLLEAGSIRPSHNPFSSLVLLVRKADGSWRMCIDYRALNQAIVKDKFPIPIIDELLDELASATIFSKLDLRSGYHQICMREEDISKTTFRTYDGHYEFCPTLELHIQHLRSVLELLQQHQLYAKKSKCAFGSSKVEYLGHIISGQGVSIDPRKTIAKEAWPIPTFVKALKEILGLNGYYRKFIKNYGQIAAPLTALLRKNAFIWYVEAETAFDQLKVAVSSGLGAVLMQNHRPIAFHSQVLKGKALQLSTYEKELLALVTTYKQGCENKVADALFRRLGVGFEDSAVSNSAVASPCLCLISFPSPSWIEELKATYQSSIVKKKLLQQLQSGSTYPKFFSLHNGLILYKGRVYLDTQNILKSKQMKHETCKPAGLLQPFLIPHKPWTAVSMDFVSGLPISQRLDTVMVIVDRLTKYVQFIGLSPFSVAKVAALFAQNVLKLHDRPTEWSDWLYLAEYWFNTNYHSATKVTPYEAVYGFPLPRLLDYILGRTQVAAVDSLLQSK